MIGQSREAESDSEDSETNYCQTKMYNRNQDNFHLTNKKALFYNLIQYYESIGEDPFKTIPITFHITEGTTDAQFTKFKHHFDEIEQTITKAKSEQVQREKGSETSSEEEEEEEDTSLIPDNVWIIKPGEYTNRGTGINVSRSLNEITSIVSGCRAKRTFIL